MHEFLCFRLNCVDAREGATERLEFDEEILVSGSCFANLSLMSLSDERAAWSSAKTLRNLTSLSSLMALLASLATIRKSATPTPGANGMLIESQRRKAVA